MITLISMTYHVRTT